MEKMKCSSNVNKTLWGIVSQLTPIYPENLTINFYGDLYDDPFLLASKFNEFLIKTPLRIVNKAKNCKNNIDNYDFKIPSNQSSMFLYPIELKEALSILRGKVEVSNSAGFDDVLVALIKVAAAHIARPLCHAITASFNEGRFPFSLKLSRVSLFIGKATFLIPTTTAPYQFVVDLQRFLNMRCNIDFWDFLRRRMSLVIVSMVFVEDFLLLPPCCPTMPSLITSRMVNALFLCSVI